MATDKSEAIRFMKIVLDWCSPQVARSMLDDMQFYIGDVTGNDSVRESIEMVRKYLYDRAEENLMLGDDCAIPPAYRSTEQGLPADYQLDN